MEWETRSLERFGCETMKWLVLLLFSSLVGGAKKLTTVQHESKKEPTNKSCKQETLTYNKTKAGPFHDPYQFTTH